MSSTDKLDGKLLSASSWTHSMGNAYGLSPKASASNHITVSWGNGRTSDYRLEAKDRLIIGDRIRSGNACAPFAEAILTRVQQQ